MAFPREQPVAPVARGGISIQFYIPDLAVEGETRVGRIGVQIHYSDNSIRERVFDLLERLGDDSEGDTHRSNLLALEEYIIGRVDTEIIGE